MVTVLSKVFINLRILDQIEFEETHLELRGRDILTGGQDNDLFDPAGDIQKAVFIKAHQIAGAKPAVLIIDALFLFADITDHHVLALQTQFAVHDLVFLIREQQTDRLGLTEVFGIAGHQIRAFGETVSGQQGDVKCLFVL